VGPLSRVAGCRALAPSICDIDLAPEMICRNVRGWLRPA
jgi:hypothetical protein